MKEKNQFLLTQKSKNVQYKRPFKLTFVGRTHRGKKEIECAVNMYKAQGGRPKFLPLDYLYF